MQVEKYNNKIRPNLYNHICPRLPWLERKEWLLKQIAIGYQQEWRYNKRDIDRLVKEGLVVRKRNASLTMLKPERYKGCPSSIRPTHRTHLKLVNPLPEPVDKRIPEPYAKRKAGLKEFLEANDLK